MDPSVVPAVVVGVLVLAAGVLVLVALAVDRADPAETAVAYEQAWDRLDFDLLWRLSGPELRAGRSREEFAAEKEALYRQRADLAALVGGVRVEQLETAGRRARAVTVLELRDGGRFRNEIRMTREGGRWQVDAYRLGPRGEEAG